MKNHFSLSKRGGVVVAVMASCLMLVSVWVEAAGLGDIAVYSQLGQPLRAEVRVSATNDELAGMVAHLASQDSYNKSGVRHSSAVRQLRFNLEKAPGGAVIRVTSEKPINDPFIDFLLELSWSNGRLTREYTFLVDPPKDLPSRPAVAATQPNAVPTTALTAVPQASRAAGAGERVVKPGETLYRIATENLPAGATLDQMQVALYRANPGAFDGSITRLRADSVLRIPALAEVTAISPDEAKRAIKGSRAPSSNAPPPGKASNAERGESATTPAPGRQAVKPATGPTEAELAARKKAVSEFNARVDNMKQEVDKLQQQIESKDEKLARIEKEKAERKAAIEAAAVAAAQSEIKIPEAITPPEVPATPATAVEPEEPPVVPEATPSEDEIQTSEPEQETLTDEREEATEPPPVPVQSSQSARPPVQLDTQEPEEGGLPLGWILGGVGALVVLVGGFLFLRRRGGDDDGATLSGASITVEPSIEPFSENFSTKGPASVFQTAGGQSVDTSNTTAPQIAEFSQAGPGAIDTNEVDPVAEADVYMAYGRDGQAEEILLDALQKDPHRLAIPVKLLEVYASRKSVKDFETLATELFAQTGGKGAEWEKVVALGSALDPSNPLYGSQGDAAVPASPFGSESAVFSLLGEDATSPEFDLLATEVAEKPAASSEFDILTSNGVKQTSPEFDLMASDAVAKPAHQPAQPQAPQKPPELSESGAFSFALDSNPVPAPTQPAIAPVEVAAPEEDDPLLSLLHEESITGAESDQELLGGETEVNSFVPEQPEPVPAAPTHTPVPAPEPVAVQDRGTISQAILDFDLGGDSIAPASEYSAESENDIAATVVNPDAIFMASGGTEKQTGAAAPATDAGNLLDFDLDVPDVVQPHAAAQDEMSDDEMAATSILSIEPDDDMEFDVQLTESTVLGNPGGGGFDLSGISLDLGGANASAPTSVAKEAEPLNVEELDEGGTVSDLRRDEVNTKLDLAKAYEEMGDLEGARELLGEVVGEGAPDQVTEAQAMLTRLNL